MLGSPLSSRGSRICREWQGASGKGCKMFVQQVLSESGIIDLETVIPQLAAQIRLCFSSKHMHREFSCTDKCVLGAFKLKLYQKN